MSHARFVVFPVLLFLTTGAALPEDGSETRKMIREALFIPSPLPALDAQTHGRFEPAAGT
jgi:hypothetical protein